MVSSLLFLILHIFILEKGLVIKNTGSWYLVKTDEGKLIECKIKGNFRLKGIRSTNPIAVGDRCVMMSPTRRRLLPVITPLISMMKTAKHRCCRYSAVS